MSAEAGRQAGEMRQRREQGASVCMGKVLKKCRACIFKKALVDHEERDAAGGECALSEQGAVLRWVERRINILFLEAYQRDTVLVRASVFSFRGRLFFRAFHTNTQDAYVFLRRFVFPQTWVKN